MLKRFFRQAYSSITDFDLYPSIVDQNLKKTLIFLLFFAALSAILATVITATQILPEVSHFFQWAETEFPPFRITEGVLLVDADQPFVCTFNSDTPVTFIFDTTGTYTSPESFKEPAMLLASKQFLIRMQGQTQSYSWEDFSSIEINNSNLGEFGKALIFLFFPLAYSSYLLWGLFSIPLFALILTPISRFVGLTYGVRFPLQKSFTIALYSQVPATAIDLAVQATGLTITYFILIYFAIGAIYTYLATQKCSMIDPEAGQR